MPRTTNPERRKKTEKELFQVAARAFLRDGYEATGMKALAAEAGCTTGKFYCYYSGKEVILIELLQELFRGNREAAGRLADKKKDRFYGVLVFLSTLYQGAKAYPNLREIYREGLEESAGRDFMEEILKEMLCEGQGEDTESDEGADCGDGAGRGDDALLRIRVAVQAIPAFFREDTAELTTEEQYLSMIAAILGESPEETEAHVKLVTGSKTAIREKAYDVLIKLLQGPKKKNVKKM